jgi:Flp pilus assembly protein TadD
MMKIHMAKTAAMAALILALAGCGNSAPQEAAAGAASTATPFQVNEIRISRDGAESVGSPVPLSVDAPIKLEIKTTGASKPAMLEATLFDLRNGKAAAVASQSVEADGKPATIAMTLARAEGDWNPGRHLLELKLDGALLAHRDVEIMTAAP